MARTQTMVQLSDELLALLDQEARSRGESRSSLIRLAIVQYLEDRREVRLVEKYLDGYRRVPPGIVDEWGDIDEQGMFATAETLRRLDREEAAAGLPPW